MGLALSRPLSNTLPLREIGTFHVERGDDYLASFGDRPIDAIKIDVQGMSRRC
jgi:hypothetical protein